MKIKEALALMLLASHVHGHVDETLLLLPEITSITVTAPRVRPQAALKTARNTGVGAATTGLGVMVYSVFFNAAGPFGWAAAVLFLGGMTAYLSQRRLKGHDDFSPGAPRFKKNQTDDE